MVLNSTGTSRALVTGASGRLGSRLVRALNLEGWQVFALSSRDTFDGLTNVTHIPHNWSEPLTQAIPEVDTVFHLAAQTSAYKAREAVALDLSTNLLATVQLLESLAKWTAPPIFIFTGSLTEYGLTDEVFVDENAPLRGQTFYESGKIAAQIYLEQFVREGWISKSITLRLSNVYGDISGNHSADRGFVDRSITKALLGESLTYFDSGEYIRDFVHIVDVVNALVSCGKQSDRLLLPAYNIGSGRGTTIKEMLFMIATEAEKFTGRSVAVTSTGFPLNAYEIERRNSISNSSLFQSAVGWVPEIHLEEGIRNSLLLQANG